MKPNSNKTQARPAPLSVRLSPEERQLLEARAGSVPLSTYLKQSALIASANARGSVRRVSVDQDLAARILAILGQSGIAASLQELARYAASGSLEMDDRTRTRLLDACEDVRAMRELLMLALGKEEPGNPSRKPPEKKQRGRDGQGLSATFNKVARGSTLTETFNAAAALTPSVKDAFNAAVHRTAPRLSPIFNETASGSEGERP